MVARAADHSLIALANQSGRVGSLDFLGRARIVGPGGDIAAETGPEPGLAAAAFDIVARTSAAAQGKAIATAARDQSGLAYVSSLRRLRGLSRVAAPPAA